MRRWTIPTWEKVDSEHTPGMRLLPENFDESRVKHEVPDLFEQARVRSAIRDAITAFISACHDERHLKSVLYLALHGRLGQGKSRVIDKLVEELDARTVHSTRWRIPIRIFRFNCADYLSDDLLTNFDHFIEKGRTFRILSWSVTLAGGITWLATILLSRLPGTANVITTELSLTPALVAAFLAGTASLRHLIRDSWRDVRIGTPLHRIFKKTIDRFFTKWDLLVIDDLDRATPEQQSALLHSLNRHRRDISGVVLVAFDDTDLLSTESPRREASELLTKVFDASYRLSPMNPSDAGQMAFMFARELASLNAPEPATVREPDRERDLQIAEMFAQPIVCGALARMFLLHGNASARFARKLLNNVYMAAKIGNFRNDSDVLALIRLHGVFHYLPVLETELEFLDQALLESTETPLFETIRERFGTALDPKVQTRLRRLISATHDMQPTGLRWSRTLRIWRDEPAGRQEDCKTPKQWAPTWTRNWAINEAILIKLSDARQRLRAYNQLINNPFALLPFREVPKSLPELEMQDETRWRGQEHDDYWRALVRRLMVFDDEVLALLNSAERDSLMDRHRESPLATLLFSHGARAQIGPPSIAFRHSLFAAHTQLEARLGHEFRKWYEEDTSEVQSLSKPPLHANGIALFKPSFITNAWPDFPCRTNSSSLGTDEAEQFRELGYILRDLPVNEALFPEAHFDWVRGAAAADRFAAIQKALHTMHSPDSSSDFSQFFHEGAQREFWRLCTAHPELRKALVLHLRANSGKRRTQEINDWILSCC